MKILYQRKQMIAFFMPGFILGILYINFFARQSLSGSGMFGLHILEQYRSAAFDAKEYFKTKYSLSFNIKPEDDNQRVIIVNKKDNGHTLKKVIVNDNYVKIDMQIPFKQSMAKKKFYTNFIIVTDDKGREMEMSGGGGSEDKIIQIHDLINKGDIPKYINISIYKSDDPNRLNPLSSFKVDLK